MRPYPASTTSPSHVFTEPGQYTVTASLGYVDFTNPDGVPAFEGPSAVGRSDSPSRRGTAAPEVVRGQNDPDAAPPRIQSAADPGRRVGGDRNKAAGAGV